VKLSVGEGVVQKFTTVIVAALTGAAVTALAQELPAPPAPAEELQFTDPDAGWPPQVEGATNVRLLPVEEEQIGLTSAFESRVREIAAASPLMQRALGERFAFISVDPVEIDKGSETLLAEQRLVRATFYSYGRNIAVRTLMRGGEILRVEDVEGFQPPESPDEIERAISLAREDPRIRDLVRELDGRALLTEVGEGHPGFGNRILYVSFLPRGSAETEVMALVDLTDGRVLEAGRPVGRQ
jgi:hypothetical protein